MTTRALTREEQEIATAKFDLDEARILHDRHPHLLTEAGLQDYQQRLDDLLEQYGASRAAGNN